MNSRRIDDHSPVIGIARWESSTVSKQGLNHFGIQLLTAALIHPLIKGTQLEIHLIKDFEAHLKVRLHFFHRFHGHSFRQTCSERFT